MYRTLYRLERTAEEVSADLVSRIADALIENIRGNWSPERPSAWGNRPAVRTGNLDSSVVKYTTGRDQLGRFSNSANAKYAFVRVDTSKGKFGDETRTPAERGNYAQALESLYNRPFLIPAMEEIGINFSREVKEDFHKGFIRAL